MLQGCLVWDAKGLFRSPLRGSLDRPANMTWPFQTSLVFCFANQVVSAPHYLDADCNCVELLTIPAHESYQDVFMAKCSSYELPDSLEQQMKSKDEASSKQLWQALPDAVRNNQHWWI